MIIARSRHVASNMCLVDELGKICSLIFVSGNSSTHFVLSKKPSFIIAVVPFERFFFITEIKLDLVLVKLHTKPKKKDYSIKVSPVVTC